MAAYNGASVIEQQFESFMDQTVVPTRVVVRDDNSTDDTFKVLEQIRDIAPFPITITRGKERLGYRDNFVEALRISDADIFFFSDQDDIWYSEKIEKHLEVYDAKPDVLAVISDQDIVGPDLEPSGRTSLEEILRRRGDNAEFVHGCCTSFRSKLHRIASHPAKGFAHDDWVHAVALSCGAREVIKTPLQAFRRHETATTSSDINAFLTRGSQSRGISSARQVAENLRRRQAGLNAIANAMRQDDSLPAHLRTHSVGYCEVSALDLGDRATRLECGGLSGMFSTARASISGKMSFRQGIADIVRIASNFLR